MIAVITLIILWSIIGAFLFHYRYRDPGAMAFDPSFGVVFVACGPLVWLALLLGALAAVYDYFDPPMNRWRRRRMRGPYWG